MPVESTWTPCFSDCLLYLYTLGRLCLEAVDIEVCRNLAAAPSFLESEYGACVPPSHHETLRTLHPGLQCYIPESAARASPAKYELERRASPAPSPSDPLRLHRRPAAHKEAEDQRRMPDMSQEKGPLLGIAAGGQDVHGKRPRLLRLHRSPVPEGE